MVSKEKGLNTSQESCPRRSRLQVKLEVLNTIKRGVKKPTRIMYASNMSWAPTQKILKSLVSSGFIRKLESKKDKRTIRYYEITQKGLNILNYFNKENDLIRLMQIN